jgi:hypothetical protein
MNIRERFFSFVATDAKRFLSRNPRSTIEGNLFGSEIAF